MAVRVVVWFKFMCKNTWFDRFGSFLAASQLFRNIFSEYTTLGNVGRGNRYMKRVVSRKHIEIVSDLFDDLPADNLFAGRICREHRIVAKIVYVAGYPLGALKDEIHRPRRKDVWLVGTGDQQTLGYITINLFDIWERMHAASKRDALLQLA